MIFIIHNYMATLAKNTFMGFFPVSKNKNLGYQPLQNTRRVYLESGSCWYTILLTSFVELFNVVHGGEGLLWLVFERNLFRSRCLQQLVHEPKHEKVMILICILF